MFFKISDARYHALNLKIEALEARFLLLKAQHEALRGRYYATRGSPTDPPAPAAGTRQEKDAILRDYLGGKIRHASNPG